MLKFNDLRRKLSRLRHYAQFFEWPQKQTKELGVVKELLRTMQLTDQTTFHTPQLGPYPNEAPDCKAFDQEGQTVALEVSEFVSKEAIDINQRTTQIEKMVYRDWQPHEVVAEVNRILTNKDTKSYDSGHYSQIVVVIHTDEPTVRSDTCASALTNETFGPYLQIDRAFFLFSYEPEVDYCPYVELRLARRRSA